MPDKVVQQRNIWGLLPHFVCRIIKDTKVDPHGVLVDLSAGVNASQSKPSPQRRRGPVRNARRAAAWGVELGPVALRLAPMKAQALRRRTLLSAMARCSTRAVRRVSVLEKNTALKSKFFDLPEGETIPSPDAQNNAVETILTVRACSYGLRDAPGSGDR
ncbi:unnamed protein product [Peniophora sp. CBMAI 1063]|nr:unnamed protein product [Peniophora sp. CBMAI 1063]